MPKQCRSKNPRLAVTGEPPKEAAKWGRRDLRGEGADRQGYLAALKAADVGDLEALVRFARSGAEREK